ncbi:GNAT family N-acetyltransferase [Hungatella hathewayi]|uniref:GNAT family N-acetyltransferase n=1 Tax=Hungatella hathewayi TaxID=154046 RepID=UPI00033FF46F|nr:GNAT family N-acetyltransferase [Hungatella hathewayi]CCZ63465.1 toxin-antitoxin system toxin component GNAT family [Hungatella hathewayi CAG:224]
MKWGKTNMIEEKTGKKREMQGKNGKKNSQKRDDPYNLVILEKRSSELIACLTGIWRRSVKETHLFLNDQEIRKIEAYVPEALLEVPVLIIAVNAENEPAAFMGADGGRLEMLFIEPEERGKGLGGRLLAYGIEKLGIRELCVNEQNPQAKGFYEHMGFTCYKRTDTDEQGNPYPLLYMRLSERKDVPV